MITGIYYEGYWPGQREERLEDLPKLADAGFTHLCTPIQRDALTAGSLDAQFLEACAVLGVQVIVSRNALTAEEYAKVAEKWPSVIWGLVARDDANLAKPAEVTAALAADRPHLRGTKSYISVGKSAKHADYAALGANAYHVQTYLGKNQAGGEGLLEYGYETMSAANAACSPTTLLLGSAWPGRYLTPWHLRNDDVWLENEYANPYVQEAIIWLQLIAGADGIVAYTARNVAYWAGQYAGYDSRLATQWNLLPCYREINGKLQAFDRFIHGQGVRRVAEVSTDDVVMGTWTLPSGEALVARVDLHSEWFPELRLEVIPAPKPAPPPKPVSAMVRIESDGKQISVERIP